MKFLIVICLVASAYGSVLRPSILPDDILRPAFPVEEVHPIELPAEIAPLVQIIVNIQKKGESAPVVEVPHFGPPAEVDQVPDFGPPAAIEEIPDVPVVAPEFQPETPIVPLVPIVPDERPPVGFFPIIPDLNRPGVPNTGMLRPQGPSEQIAISPW